MSLSLIVCLALIMTHVGNETFERGQKELLNAFAPDFVQVLHHKGASMQDLDHLLFNIQGIFELMILDQQFVNAGFVPMPEEFGQCFMLLVRLLLVV